jgi:hypothetical protein
VGVNDEAPRRGGTEADERELAEADLPGPPRQRNKRDRDDRVDEHESREDQPRL